jgi:hypothetical protein
MVPLITEAHGPARVAITVIVIVLASAGVVAQFVATSFAERLKYVQRRLRSSFPLAEIRIWEVIDLKNVYHHFVCLRHDVRGCK